MTRVAVVTGAARGIGAAVVDGLATAGYLVVAADIGRDLPGVPYPLGSAEELAKVAAAHPGRVTTALVDVRDAEAVQTMVKDTVREHGGLDVAVAAAAIIAGGRPLWQTPAADLRLLLDIDVAGVWNLAAAAVPAMLERPEPRSGRFVALASAAAHHGLWGLSAYCAAKHAVHGLIRGLAADLRETGITATAVSPGSTRTAMLDATAALYGLDGTDQLTATMLTGRALEPDEVAAAVCFLCSPAASAITGSVLHADGGFS